MSASEVVQQATRAAMGTGDSTNAISVETVKEWRPWPADQPAPRSDSPAAADSRLIGARRQLHRSAPDRLRRQSPASAAT